VSVISYIEVLGCHKLTEDDRQFLEQFFQTAERLPLSETVVQWAIKLRQQRKMSLGDSKDGMGDVASKDGMGDVAG
jgi:hypothetical protein